MRWPIPLARPHRKPRKSGQRRKRPQLERLEDRTLLDVTPIGTDFQVNTTITGRQEEPAVAMDNDGDFVVVWMGQVDTDFEIFGQRYDATGTPVGDEFLVNTTSAGDQRVPSVAMDPDGDFVVAWQSYTNNNDNEIIARRFDSTGTPDPTGEIQVNTSQAGSQRNPQVAIDMDGDFVVAWDSFLDNGDQTYTVGVHARRFDAMGTALTAELTLRSETFPVDQQQIQLPDVASDAAGNFIVVWEELTETTDRDIFAQRFQADGTPLDATPFVVNATTADVQENPSVAMDAGGNFAVAWQSLNQDGDNLGIFVRTFDPTGMPTSGEIAVNTTTDGDQENPNLAMDAAGNFLVTWEGPDGEPVDDRGVFVRQFSANGTALTGELRVNQDTANSQRNGAVALNPDGTVAVIAWEDSSRDTSLTGIFGQRFNVTVDGDQVATNFLVEAPDNVTAGVPFNFTVTARDDQGNTVTNYSGTVTFTSSDPAATLPADMMLTDGTGTFTATLRTAGSQTITATDTQNAALTGSDTITVDPGAAAILIVDAPETVMVGMPFNFTVTAQDNEGNIVTGYTGTVAFTSSDPQADLPANSMLTNGMGTFTATLNTAGTQSITATDTLDPTITGSDTLQVSPGPAVSLMIDAPANATTGVPFNFTVTALDEQGNTATGYTGTVMFSSSDPQATLPAPMMLTDGVGTFTATLNTNGAQTLTATDTQDPTLTDTVTITVSDVVATRLVIDAPATVTSGAPFSFTVTAQDDQGNIATGYTGTVMFTSSDPTASLPAPTMLTNGTGTFTATLNTAGIQTLTATDTQDPTITGTANITVEPGAVSRFVVTAPDQVAPGMQFNFAVTAQDAAGNTVTDYSGTVTFSSSDPQAELPLDMMLTNGTGTFTATLNTAGSQTITATDTQDPTITGSATVNVSTGAAVSFLVDAPATATSGMPFTFTVTAQDEQGNTATGYTGTVTFSSSDPAAELPLDMMLTNGVGTFTATLNTAGSQTIVATDTQDPTITGSDTVMVTAGAAVRFTVNAPASATIGTPFTFTVTAEDEAGNTATGYTGTVAFTSSDPQASLPANTTLTNGMGTFTATLNTAGNQTITATDTQNASITGSDTVSVMPQVMMPTTTSLVSSANPSQIGQPVTFTATVSSISGVPTGTVTFRDGSTTLGTVALVGGQARLTTSALAAGAHVITASYGGSATFSASTSAPLIQTVLGGDPNANFVVRAYQTLLGRSPTPEEVAFVLGRFAEGASRQDLAIGIITSTEYQVRVVQDLFMTYLRRPADQDGLVNAVMFLASGGTMEQLEAIILGSEEYFITRGGGTNEGFLAALYQDVLGRPIDAAGQANALAALAQGVSRTTVAQAVLQSVEGDTVQTMMLYQEILNRPADQPGLVNAVMLLQQGLSEESLIAAMVASDEFFLGL